MGPSGLSLRRRGLRAVAPVVAIAIAIAALVSSPVYAAVPSIAGIATTNVLTNGVTVIWATDVPADTQIDYGASTSYGSSTTLNTALVTSHSQAITGLAANQLYHYRVRSRSAAGELAASPDRTFMTRLGTTTAGLSTDSSDSNGMNATRFTTGAGGLVTSLSANVGAVDANTARRSFQMAIYTASGTVPGTLVASSASGTLVANSWKVQVRPVGERQVGDVADIASPRRIAR